MTLFLVDVDFQHIETYMDKQKINLSFCLTAVTAPMPPEAKERILDMFSLDKRL